MKLLSLSLLLFLMSCSSASHLRTDDSSTKYESYDGKVRVYTEAKKPRRYNILGVVVASADSGEDSIEVVEMLKEQASKLGANGLIDLRIKVNYGFWTNGIEASGVAVRL